MAKLTGPNFRLSKTTKRMTATMVKAEDRNTFRRAMIDAQYTASLVPKTKKERGQLIEVVED